MHRLRIRAKEKESKRVVEVSPFSDVEQPEKLGWRLLPPGEHPFAEIVRHYQGLRGANARIEYEVERLNRVYHLGPSSTFIGLDQFEGYIVFYFAHSQIAVLECPVVGNAIYVIRGNWRVLSGLSKVQLLRRHRQNVVRIVHTGNWFPKLKALLHRQ